MNGALRLAAKNGKYYVVLGGPYMERPEGTVGVLLAKELAGSSDYDVVLPIQDFSVPTRRDLLRVVDEVLDYMLAGRAVYVGCMGGRGRTGLFLAALAKLWGVRRPVQYVRGKYFSHAVETKEQEAFIRRLRFPLKFRAKVWYARVFGYLPMSMTRLPRAVAADLELRERRVRDERQLIADRFAL
jgi:hypothetical protein